MKILSKHKINNSDIDDLINTQEINSIIRQLRKPLLEAFDIYKTNIAYGIEVETDEEKEHILAWYNNLLDKNVDALRNIPNKILRYL